MTTPASRSKSRSLPAPERALFAGLLLLLALAGLLTGALQRIDHLIYDMFLRGLNEPVQDQLAIVGIDEVSLNELGQWPWPRQRHAELIGELQKQGVQAIAFDILFAEPDSRDPTQDTELATAIHNHGKVLLPLHINPLSPASPLAEILPLPNLVEAAAGIGHVHVELDSDGIARGLYLYQGIGTATWPALSLAVLQQVEPDRAQSYEAPESDQGSPWFNVRTQYFQIPFVGPSGSIPTYSYSDVLYHRLPPESLRDKVIFVGAVAAGLGDVLPTPYSGTAAPMPGVEIHANIYNALYQHSLIHQAAPRWVYVLTLVLVLIPAVLFPRIAPDQNLPLTLLLLGIVLGVSYALLASLRLWFPPAVALVVLACAYPMWSWRRLQRLNHFLNQELRRLSREPVLAAAELNGDRIELWFRRVVKLVQPSEYALFRNATLLEGNQPALRPRSGFPERQWSQREGSWWLRFSTSPQQRYLAVMRWQDPVENLSARVRSLANLLPPRDLTQYSGSLRPTELLERRIQQVQRAISAMRSMRQFIGDSFQHMPDGILVTDRLGLVLFANRHCKDWLRASDKEILNRPLADWLQAYPNLDQLPWDELIRQVLVMGHAASTGLRLTDRELLVQMVPFAAGDNHDSGLIASFSDVTRLREEQRRRLETIDFVSHDLRAPLVSQMALLDQIAHDPRAELDEVLRRTRFYTEKSLELADQFLQLTRVEAAEDIIFYDCDLLAILENAIDQAQHQAQRKNMRLEINPDAEEAWMAGNAELLERMTLNLLTNAIKFSPPDTTVRSHVWREGAHNFLMVEDQGSGISAEEKHLLFGRFQRLPSAERQRISGTGLGLRFVAEVVQRHQGEIKVESEPGRGARFIVQLPVPPEEA